MIFPSALPGSPGADGIAPSTSGGTVTGTAARNEAGSYGVDGAANAGDAVNSDTDSTDAGNAANN